MTSILFIVCAYLIGSLSFAVIVSHAFGLPDPHSYGSGNPGATNVLRTGRKAAALITLLGDGGKGWLAVFAAIKLAPQFALGPEVIAGVFLAVFLGHIYPVFFGFRGGKGVATALGVLLAVDPWLGLAALATWLVIFALFKISSLSAIIAAVTAPLYDLAMAGPRLLTASIVVMSVLLLWRHSANIRRLLAGEEGKVGNKPAVAAPSEKGQ